MFHHDCLYMELYIILTILYLYLEYHVQYLHFTCSGHYLCSIKYTEVYGNTSRDGEGLIMHRLAPSPLGAESVLQNEKKMEEHVSKLVAIQRRNLLNLCRLVSRKEGFSRQAQFMYRCIYTSCTQDVC